MVDWSLARQVARFAAGSDEPLAVDAGLAERVARIEPEVAGYTRLELAAPMPSPELLSRNEWAAMNLDGLSRLLDPVAGRLEDRLGFAGPLAGALRAGASATLAAEAGLVIGYVATRVLGQYELSLLQPGAAPRLVFVAPNLERAVRELSVDREGFLDWIVFHELTHVFQFQGVAWLREHMEEMIRGYLETVEVQVKHGAAGGLPSLPNVAKLVDAFREGGLAALVQTREQRDLMNRMQATMAVIEGYSEHVMDALASKLLRGNEELRAAMTRRRASRSAPERIFERLLGLDFKMRQYELGKRFSDGVVERAGIEGLNRVWDGPESMPTMSELTRPEAWIARTTPAPAAA